MIRFIQTIALAAAMLMAVSGASFADDTWPCEILPSEAEITNDATSGARLIYVTNSPDEDGNLYFHQNSWLPDSSMLIFHRKVDGKQIYFGYIEATRELARLHKDALKVEGDPTCSRFRNSLYLIMDKKLHEWSFVVEPARDGKPSQASLTDRIIGPLPEDSTGAVGMTENSDGTAVSIGFNSNGPNSTRIILMDLRDGSIKELMAMQDGISHIQSSWVTPDLVLFCRASRVTDRARENDKGFTLARMWLCDSTDREPWPVYPQLEGELVTHECWWVNNQIVFCCGMQKNGNAEEAHVKVIDLANGITRIIGGGAWWPTGTAEEVSKFNWWHCAGGPNGKFVVGDNWHGDIGIFSAKTARTRLLTQNHREYGKGAHPHVGWDPTGTRLVFATNRRGNSDICIAEMPQAWLSEDW